MVLQYVWLCPVITASYSLLSLLICFGISAYYHHLPPRWPFLSEIAIRSPESNVYSMMTNHIAVLVAIWVYLKHREIVSYFSMEGERKWKRTFSFWNMCIGLLGSICLQISANFPKMKVPLIQTSASLILLFCSVIYTWIHTAFSFFIVDANIARMKLFLVRSSLAATLTSCCGSMLKVFEQRGHNFDHTTPAPYDITSTGALYEWGVYFSMCLFLLTDAYEFRNLIFHAPKLVIPGSPLYDERRIISAPPINRREMSFTDLATTSLSIPLVR